MIEFKDLLALAVNRKGGLKPVEAQLPAVKSAAQLRRPDDAFYLVHRALAGTLPLHLVRRSG